MSQDDTTYNGWRNRSTWLVNLWFNPSSSDLEWIKDALEEWVSDLTNSKNVIDNFFADQINLQEIDWKELAEHLEPLTLNPEPFIINHEDC